MVFHIHVSSRIPRFGRIIHNTETACTNEISVTPQSAFVDRYAPSVSTPTFSGRSQTRRGAVFSSVVQDVDCFDLVFRHFRFCLGFSLHRFTSWRVLQVFAVINAFFWEAGRSKSRPNVCIHCASRPAIRTGCSSGRRSQTRMIQGSLENGCTAFSA